LVYNFSYYYILFIFIYFSVLIDEINEYDKKQKEIINDANLSSNRLKDYKKTSLLKSVNIFEEFLRNLENTWKGSRIKQSGKL
jgi:DNA primase small subunit